MKFFSISYLIEFGENLMPNINLVLIPRDALLPLLATMEILIVPSLPSMCTFLLILILCTGELFVNILLPCQMVVLEHSH